jgi:hypothetical protein
MGIILSVDAIIQLKKKSLFLFGARSTIGAFKRGHKRVG